MLLNMHKINLGEISKTISHALRHEPWNYDLELDEQGWVDIDLLISSVTETLGVEFDQNTIQEILDQSEKKRFELVGDKIRAFYGHSTPEKIVYKVTEPPVNLYHGTTPETASKILLEGLKPMSRQYVHLSKTIDIAHNVAGRRTNSPIILKIEAKKAYANEVKFYNPSDVIWLSDFVSSEFISLV
jgi:putative RNA 2'-phosphotransferase